MRCSTGTETFALLAQNTLPQQRRIHGGVGAEYLAVLAEYLTAPAQNT